MIPVKLIEANNFRIQEKTYNIENIWCIIDLYTVFPVSTVLNGHGPPANVQEVQLKIKR